MTTIEKPAITSLAKTPDEMKHHMYEAYGIWVSSIGEDGDMIALGHHEPKRVIAAFNRYSRDELGFVNLVDYTWPSTYRSIAADLTWKHARLVTTCDSDDHDLDLREIDRCPRCEMLRDSAWFLDWSEPQGGDTFPVTLWRP